MTDDYWLTEGLCPLYTCEHSKFRLLWWSFKTGFITTYNCNKKKGIEFLKAKLLNKLIPHNFYRIFRRYISNKT